VEARTLATFRHPNIVRVARFFEANHTAYMVLEFERGQSLKQWRQKRQFVPENVLVERLAPLLDGLAAVHAAGYLHRDIKPDNIHVRDDDGTLVLLDFGSARQTASEKADAGAVVTPGYGPIEQYANGGRQGPWTDIYSFGATLFWVVTGRKPIDAPSRLADPDPQPRAEDLCRGRYSPEFLRAIDWALAMHPTHRPQDVAQFRSALFATHSALLGLEEALRDGDEDHTPGNEAWAATLRSPHLIRRRLARFTRSLDRPGSWPLAAKMTLAVRMGRANAVALYRLLVVGAFVVLPIALVAGDASLLPLIGLAALPMALKPMRVVGERSDGPALNGALAATGAVLGVFSLLVTAGLLISS